MNSTHCTPLSGQRGLSPVSQQILIHTGITSVEQLRQMGSVTAYAQVRRSGAIVSLNLLWALEGVISETPWQTVERMHRTRLLLALQEKERLMRHTA